MDNNTISLIMMILLFAVFYFVLIRPQRQKDKQIQEMRKALKVGDQIVTIGGIYGKIIRIKDENLVIQTSSDRTKLEMARWAVSSVVAEGDGSAKAAKEEVEEASKPSPKTIKKLGKAEEAVEEAVDAAAETVTEAAQETTAE